MVFKCKCSVKRKKKVTESYSYLDGKLEYYIEKLLYNNELGELNR